MTDQSNEHPLSGMTAVIVEDDGVAAEITARILIQQGVDVRVAPAGAIALSSISQSPADIVICDVDLPDCSGVDVARSVREASPEAAIVMATGDRTFTTAVESIRAGADDYIGKPVDAAELLPMIYGALTRRRATRRSESVLAIGAHPDDVEIGCGGMLLAHVERGDRVTVLTLSAGAQGGDTSLRGQESRRAAEELGAELLMHDLPDTAIEVGQATINPIIEAITATDATLIYTHTDKDVHQDHRSVHRSTLVAAREVPRLFTYQAPSTSADFLPTRFEDITQYLDAKIRLIECYATQDDRPYLEHELLRSTARYWARFARGTRYVEPFEVVRDAHHQQTPAPFASARVSA